MNKRGKTFVVKGFALVTVFMLLVLALFALIQPFKENLDNSRGSTSLNCPGTPGFNQTAYNNQSTYQKLNVRGTCFVTGISFVWFIGAFLVAAVVWLFRNWS